MKKITDNKTGETFMGEFWIAEVKDGVRTLKVKLTDETELDRYDAEDVPEEKPFEEVAKVMSKKIAAPWDQMEYIKVADIDYYEILPDGTKKTEFTWDEAMEIEKKTHGKWRVPTVPEIFAICAAFGRSEDGMDVDPQVLKETLGLDGTGDYWSAATYSTSLSRYLNFYASYLLPRYGANKGTGFAVRCVASSV